jgi:hypothetical protein
MTLMQRRRSVPARPPRTRSGRVELVGWRPLLVQVALVTAAALCYFAVRNVTQGAEVPAQANARSILSVERTLHLDIEDRCQDLIIDHAWAVNLANWVYIYGHWPVIGITLVWLFLRVPDEYRLLRNAMFVSGAIGLVIFALFPVAPPRLGVLELVDTVTERSDSYRALQPPGLINRYAALPSLHFGWNLLVGIVIWRVSTSRVMHVVAVLMPVAMGLAVVTTANHYVLDVVAGAVVALIGLAAAFLMGRVWDRHSPAAHARV